jgi:hypothetical protein
MQQRMASQHLNTLRQFTPLSRNNGTVLTAPEMGFLKLNILLLQDGQRLASRWNPKKEWPVVS